jgi:hypothetical protein
MKQLTITAIESRLEILNKMLDQIYVMEKNRTGGLETIATALEEEIYALTHELEERIEG